LLLSVKGISIC